MIILCSKIKFSSNRLINISSVNDELSYNYDLLLYYIIYNNLWRMVIIRDARPTVVIHFDSFCRLFHKSQHHN